MRIEVIGVSWTLAVIFVFYLLFPFFCFLIGNKKRAWGVAVAALVFNLLCGTYFFDGKCSTCDMNCVINNGLSEASNMENYDVQVLLIFELVRNT